jgi:hypothetical protein
MLNDEWRRESSGLSSFVIPSSFVISAFVIFETCAVYGKIAETPATVPAWAIRPLRFNWGG